MGRQAKDTHRELSFASCPISVEKTSVHLISTLFGSLGSPLLEAFNIFCVCLQGALPYVFVMLQARDWLPPIGFGEQSATAPLNPAWGSFSLLFFWFQSWRVWGLVGEPSALQQPAVHTHSTFFLLHVF